MTLKIERGTLEQYKEALRPMFKEHWDEIGMVGSQDLELDVNEEHYKFLDKNKMYLALALKTEEDKLIGYLSIFVHSHIHHQNVNFATVDCFLIKREYRNLNGFVSIIKMFKQAEKILKDEFSVKYFHFACSVNNPLEGLAKRLGFVPSDMLYLKKLEK